MEEHNWNTRCGLKLRCDAFSHAYVYLNVDLCGTYEACEDLGMQVYFTILVTHVKNVMHREYVKICRENRN